MAKQDGWKPHDAQPEPLLPISSELGTYYGELSKFVGQPRPTGPRRKVEAAFASFGGQGSQTSSKPRRDASLRPPLGTINVIFATPGRTGSCPSKVMSVALLLA